MRLFLHEAFAVAVTAVTYLRDFRVGHCPDLWKGRPAACTKDHTWHTQSNRGADRRTHSGD